MNDQLAEMRSSSAQTEQTIAILRDQAATMKGQLDEMRAENRPRINVDAAIGDVRWDGSGLHFPIQYTIQDFGRTSALHVTLRDELGNNLVENQNDNAVYRLKTISKELRSGKPFGGYPIPPGSRITSVSNLSFSRDRIDILNKYLETFKSGPNDQSPPIGDIKLLPIIVVFVVDYLADKGDIHYQYACLADVYEINKDNPFGPGLSLPIDVNLPASRLKLSYSPFFCNAD